MTLIEALELAVANYKKPESVTVILCEKVDPVAYILFQLGIHCAQSQSAQRVYFNRENGSRIFLRGFRSTNPEHLAGYCSESYLGISIDLPREKKSLLEVLRSNIRRQGDSVIEVRSNSCSESRFARRMMMLDPEFMRSIALSDGEIKAIKAVEDFETVTSRGITSVNLSVALGKSLPNASAKLKKLFTKGYLSRVQSDDASGGIVYFYRVKRL